MSASHLNVPHEVIVIQFVQTEHLRPNAKHRRQSREKDMNIVIMHSLSTRRCRFPHLVCAITDAARRSFPCVSASSPKLCPLFRVATFPIPCLWMAVTPDTII